MKATSELVTTERYQKAQTQWTSLLEMEENVAVIFPYLSDRQFRVFQWFQQLDNDVFYPVLLNFSARSFDEFADLEQHLNSLLPKEWQKNTLKESLIHADKKLVLVTIDGESLTQPQNERMLAFLQTVLLTHSGKVVSLTTFELDVYQTIPAINDYNKLFQNILYYPLYSDQDMSLFIKYLCLKWQLKMPSPIRKSIIKACGGSFWIAKEACRTYRDSNVWNQEVKSIQFRIASIAKALTAQEVTVLNALPHTTMYEESPEYQHLVNIGLIYEKNKLRIPLLRPYLRKLSQPSKPLELNNNEIFLRGVSLSHVLSQTEYAILRLFLTQPNTPLDRDTIAKIMWPNNTEDSYSQWAIDQAVKRLRDRLVSLQLPPTIISSVRGVGYEYRA